MSAPSPIPLEPAFSDAEYERRIRSVRSGMAQRGLDVLVLFGPHSVNYLSGMDTENLFDFQCLILPREGDPTLVLLDFERGRHDNSAWLRNRVFFDSATFEDPIDATAALLAERGLANAHIGIEQRFTALDPLRFQRLTTALPKARIEDPFGVVEDVRLVKSDEELNHMRRAASLTDQAVEAAYRMIAPGVRDYEVAATIMGVLYGQGGDTVPWGPVVAAGYRSGLAHSTFNGYTIQQGDAVYLEITGQYRRYTSPSMRTAIVGEPTPDMRQLEDAGRACIEDIMTAARPGVPAREVAEAGLRRIRPIESEIAFHYYFGYSVGLGYPPTWIEQLGFFLRTDNPRPLQEGMVFHLPISLRKYGEYGVNLSQAILITSDGGVPLSRLPARLEPVAKA